MDDWNTMGDSLHTALHDICMPPVPLCEVETRPPSGSFLGPYGPLGVELAASAWGK